MRTTDSGASYAQVGPAHIYRWTYDGFTNPQHGVGVTQPDEDELFVTTDAGATVS